MAKCPHCGYYTAVPDEASVSGSYPEGASHLPEEVGTRSPKEDQAEAITNPFTGIWFNPRPAIRTALARNLQVEAYIFAGIYGIVHNLNLLQRHGIDAESGISLWGIVVANIVGGALVGISILVLFSALVSWTGKLLGGRSSARNARIALGWSCFPYAVLLLIIPLILFEPGTFVYHPKGQMPLSTTAGLYTLVRGVTVIWSLIILVVSTSEALGLSTKRAVLALIAPAILFALITFLFVFAYAQVIH